MTLSARDQLERFRGTWIQQALPVDGVDWRYFDSGGEGPVYLLLQGGLGDGESCFPIFEPLAAAGRVVAPSIPTTVQTVSSVVRGLKAILERIGKQQVHVFGHSQGGYLAQVLVRAIPSRVASLALSATCLPSEERARTLERQLRFVGMLPEYALRAAVIIQLRRIASVDLKTLSPDDREFWRRYLTDGVRAQGLKERATASARLQLDFHKNSGFISGDLDRWKGRRLILTCELDAIMRPQEARALVGEYQDGVHQELLGQGHLGPFLRPEPIVSFLVQLAR
jgi:pimeloyl-ACP methyl ester carboxylesterase